MPGPKLGPLAVIYRVDDQPSCDDVPNLGGLEFLKEVSGPDGVGPAYRGRYQQVRDEVTGMVLDFFIPDGQPMSVEEARRHLETRWSE